MLSDKYVPLYLIGVLVFSLLGFIVLRNFFDKIADISETISQDFVTELTGDKIKTEADELQNIVESFTAIQKRFSNTFRQLDKKASEISILKELSELCYVTFDPEEILYVTLERALLLTGSDLGSILTLEKRGRKEFVVKASVGLGE